MFRKQALIFVGMLAAVVVGIAVAFYLPWGAPDPPPQNDGERLAFAARWLLVPGLALFAGIGMTANQRFLKVDAIDGERKVENWAFEVNLRYNQNTLEQLALAAVAWTGLTLALQADQLGIIPRLAGLFGAGRVAFWLGYLYAPWARAFGMGLTAYPSFAALVFLVWRAFQPIAE